MERSDNLPHSLFTHTAPTILYLGIIHPAQRTVVFRVCATWCRSQMHHPCNELPPQILLQISRRKCTDPSQVKLWTDQPLPNLSRADPPQRTKPCAAYTMKAVTSKPKCQATRHISSISHHPRTHSLFVNYGLDLELSWPSLGPKANPPTTSISEPKCIPQPYPRTDKR